MKSGLAAIGPPLTAMALTAPWLLSPQGAPSAEVLPWLFSLACTGLLVGVVPLTVSGWRSHECRALLAGAWLAAALASSVIALCQYFGVDQHFFFMSASQLGEAFGNLRQRNQFATLTNIGLMALLWWTVQDGKLAQANQKTSSRQLAAIVLAAGNAASSSRTGLLQLVAIITVASWWWGSRHPAARRLLATTGLAYGLAALILPTLAGLDFASSGILSRLKEGQACGARLTLWNNVLYLISQRPWAGWGWGELDYAHFVTVYPGARFCDILDNAHNLPLHLAVTLGIPVALLVCGTLGWLIVRAKPWQEHDDARRMAWGIVMVILLHSLLEYPLWYGPFQMAMLLCVGLLWPAPTHASDPISVQREGVPVWQMALSTALIAAAAIAAWDYHRVSQIYRDPEHRAPAYRENTLEKIRDSWLFSNQVRFAEFTLTPLTRDNAESLNAMGHQLLHYSPEARVVEKLIESAVLLGRDDEALFLLMRYKAAYPKEHDRWALEHSRKS
jgi:O-antigen ligase